MEVRNEVFLEALETLKSSIDGADFIAVDFELSGLHTSKDAQPGALDGPEDYFRKMRESAQRAVLQFGVCCFRTVERGSQRKELIAEPYNIYVSKRPFRNKFCNDRFVFQADSIDFLTNCQFDFNKCFREGVSYLNQGEAVVVQEWLERDREEIEERGLLRQSTDDRKVDLSRLRGNDAKFLNELKGNVAALLKADTSKPSHFLLPSSNSYLRRIAFQVVADTNDILHVGKFPKDNLRMKNQFRNNATLRVTKCRSKEGVKELEQQRITETLASSTKETKEAIGIGLVVDLLLRKKVPIIGHNCFLDLLHMYHKFVKPVDEDLESFRRDFHADFPSVYDTKWMLIANTSRLCSELQGRTFLSNAYETVRKHKQFQRSNPRIRIATSNAFSRYHCLNSSIIAQAFEHEAGYDAFMTGVLYACLKEQGNLQLYSTNNCLNLMRSSSCLRLDVKNPEVDRVKSTIRIVDFPRRTKAYDIQRLFRSELGSDAKSQFITFENDTSALVTLDNPGQVDTILRRNGVRSGHNSDNKGRLGFTDFSMSRYTLPTDEFSSSNPKRSGPTSDSEDRDPPSRKKRKVTTSSTDDGPFTNRRWDCHIA